MAGLISLTGCQNVSEISSEVNNKGLAMIRLGYKEKAAEIDQKGVVDISKTTWEQIEKLTTTIPIGQWVYIEK